MALTDELTIRPIGPDAVAEGLALTVEASWNQTAEDWAFFLAHAMMFGVDVTEKRNEIPRDCPTEVKMS